MTAYKILVESSVKFEERFRKFIKNGDVVRNEPFILNFGITNISIELFPGGTVDQMVLSQTGLLEAILLQGRKGIAIGPLPPNVSQSIEFGANVNWEGPIKIILKLIASDGKPIEYYQHREAPAQKDAWLNFVYSIGREKLLMLESLDKILKQLRESSKSDTDG